MNSLKNVKTANFFEINSFKDLEKNICHVNNNGILKTSEFGYDGKGQYKIENGKPIAAFEYKDYHTNSIGSLHGGMIMSFADYALFIIGHKLTSVSNYVTISCSTDFLKASFKKW